MKKGILATFVAIALGSAIMVSCQKENEPANPAKESAIPNKGMNEEMSEEMGEAEARVLAFLDAYAEYQKGMKGGDEMVKLDDARWLWETTLNYCYSFPCTQVEGITRETLNVEVPELVGAESLTEETVMAVYARIINKVSSYYHALPSNSKVLRYVMVSLPDGESKNEDNIEIMVSTGDEMDENPSGGGRPWYGIPFIVGDDYDYVTAATMLELAVHNYDMQHSLYYTPCADCYTFVRDRYLANRYSFPDGDDWVYHNCEESSTPFSTPTIIRHNEMNQLYADIMTHTHYEGMIINPYNVDWYFETFVNVPRVTSEEFAGCELHMVWVYNATREWRHLSDYPIEMPGTPGGDNND